MRSIPNSLSFAALTILVGCASCPPNDPRLIRSGLGYCHEGKRIDPWVADSLVSTDSVAARDLSASTALGTVGEISSIAPVYIITSSFFACVLTWGATCPAFVFEGPFLFGAGVTTAGGFGMLIAGGAYREAAYERYNDAVIPWRESRRAAGDSSSAAPPPPPARLDKRKGAHRADRL